MEKFFALMRSIREARKQLLLLERKESKLNIGVNNTESEKDQKPINSGSTSTTAPDQRSIKHSGSWVPSFELEDFTTHDDKDARGARVPPHELSISPRLVLTNPPGKEGVQQVHDLDLNLTL